MRKGGIVHEVSLTQVSGFLQEIVAQDHRPAPFSRPLNPEALARIKTQSVGPLSTLSGHCRWCENQEFRNR